MKRERYDPGKYEKPSVTVDLVILTLGDRDLKVLLIKRKVAPYVGRWALPGGFVGMKETLEAAARRELEEEAGVRDVYLEQLYTFGDPKRDPRMRVITVAYYALIPSDELEIKASTDASDVRWYSVYDRPRLAFDHDKIVDYALDRIRNKIMYVPIAFQLLPDKFTLTELQQVYEVILNTPLDKRNFRKKILSSGLLKETREIRQEGRHRPAALYKFVPAESGG
ncbi:MAG: NUDIX hydrolase [Armatimonadetes bacterium]|nr:NUDIX hydrolase [Armatimonadota bacterium]